MKKDRAKKAGRKSPGIVEVRGWEGLEKGQVAGSVKRPLDIPKRRRQVASLS